MNGSAAVSKAASNRTVTRRIGDPPCACWKIPVPDLMLLVRQPGHPARAGPVGFASPDYSEFALVERRSSAGCRDRRVLCQDQWPLGRRLTQRTRAGGARRVGRRGTRDDALARFAGGLPGRHRRKCVGMLKAQMLATALDVYFSDPALGANKIDVPAPIGAAV